MPRAVKNSAEEKETKSKAKATSTVKKSTKAKSTTVSKAKKETKTAKSTTPKKSKKVVKKAVKIIKPSDLLETVKASEVKKSADITTPKGTTKTVKKVEEKKVSESKVTKKSTKVSKSADSKKTTKAVKVEEPKKVTKKAVAKKTTSTAKKTDTNKKATATKKVAPKKTTKTTTKKESTKKVATVKPVKKATKKSTKKVAKVTSLATKRRSSTTSKTKKVKEVQKDFANILEYYDLPYRYNDTIVKILAQTPKVLFVYWDISDSDRENYIKKYGEYFFNDTYPVLIIHNKTLNYYQELEINDFANSWYISISDSRSEYTVELGRRFKEYAKRNEKQPHKEDLNNLIYIKKSNNLIVPNDRVLLDEIGPKVKYRNVKTGEEFYKDTRTILAGNKLIDFYELYKGIYQVEDLSNFFVLNNPSSGNPTSTFK